MKKIIVLHNIISPIRIFLFNELDKYYKKKEIKFKVIFLSVSDKNRNWKINYKMNFSYEILDNFSIRIAGKDLNTFFINPGIYKKIQQENPDRIISFGWDNWAAYIAAYWCKKNKKVFTLWSGSTKFEKSWRRTVFNPLVKYIIRNSNNFIAYGTRAKEYLISLGANPKKIQIFYNAVNIDYFKNKSENFSEEKKRLLKQKLKIKTSKIILFSGQIIERKGIFELLEGFQGYQKTNADISLLILGKGQEKERIKEIIKEQNIQNVFFTDFIQYDELYKYYSISDLLITPSREEVWGLVINEALACGLPVITTIVAGAGADLVEEGKNGYIIKPNNPKEITLAIGKVFENKLYIRNNSKEILKKTDIPNMINKISIIFL